jgi:protein-disulfide isomerase
MPTTMSRRVSRGQARRLWQLAGAFAIAACAVAVLIAVSRSGADKTTPASAAQVTAVNDRFAGIPQQGIALGNPKAPATLVEFADLQCPFCRQFAGNVLPTLVADYVRTGKLRIEFRNLAFIGPDSRTAAQAAAGAAAQNRLWPFIDLFYADQREENTGYVTQGFLRKVAGGVRGLDVDRALSDGTGAQAGAQIAAAQALASQHGVQSTPSFLFGRTGRTLEPLVVDQLSASSFTGPIGRLTG